MTTVEPKDVPEGQRHQTLRDTAFAMAQQGYTNHQILSNLAHMSEQMGKYTDDRNLFEKWTALLGMVREVRVAGHVAGKVSEKDSDDPGADDAAAQGLHIYIMARPIAPDSWLNEDRFADFRNAYSYAAGRRSAIIGLSKVSPEEAYFVWRCIQTGMERLERERTT